MSKRRKQPTERQPSGRERLVAALQAENPVCLELLLRAQAGWYDEFDSTGKPGPMAPLVALVNDLLEAGYPALAKRAAAGEFDAAKWEADEWARSEEGQRAIAELNSGMHDDTLAAMGLPPAKGVAYRVANVTPR